MEEKITMYETVIREEASPYLKKGIDGLHKAVEEIIRDCEFIKGDFRFKYGETLAKDGKVYVSAFVETPAASFVPIRRITDAIRKNHLFRAYVFDGGVIHISYFETIDFEQSKLAEIENNNINNSKQK